MDPMPVDLHVGRERDCCEGVTGSYLVLQAPIVIN